ncbi:MAG: DUF2132 domain-containing protein [Burkholderiaceae bacterium]|nr:DUF2132 domain-containing protein [Burkholderiaceae bacterium]MBP6814059.1 DUF2132 domain-containing protein [Burkholderiaceae bacterium]MBP7659540.1 DUF2132 domain-containing protein [Burkholderiaceae bacterium]
MSSLPETPPAQPRNPLHGVTLEALVTALVERYGWDGLARRAPMRCFSSDPSMASSLKFLRKTPWAREKVEQIYLAMLRDRSASAPEAPVTGAKGPEAKAAKG